MLTSFLKVVLLSGLFITTACKTTNPLSFLPHDREDRKKPTSLEEGKALWIEGKYRDSLPYFSKACVDANDCEPEVKALLALERFSEAGLVAEKACANSNASRNSVCSVAALIQNHLKPKSDLSVLLSPKCEKGDHGACATLGLFLIKKGSWEESEVPLRNGCHAKDLASCHRLGMLVWHQKKQRESLDVFQQNCNIGWARSCRWLEVLIPFSEKRTSVKAKEKACRTAREDGACHDIGILKLVSENSNKRGMAALKEACDKYEDSESCWEFFIEKSELFPPESLKSELAALCEDGVGNACRNLAELQLRMGRKKESGELFTKGCQSDDKISCQKLQDLSKEEAAGQKPAAS